MGGAKNIPLPGAIHGKLMSAYWACYPVWKKGISHRILTSLPGRVKMIFAHHGKAICNCSMLSILGSFDCLPVSGTDMSGKDGVAIVWRWVLSGLEVDGYMFPYPYHMCLLLVPSARSPFIFDRSLLFTLVA